jgi:hypothetical protein
VFPVLPPTALVSESPSTLFPSFRPRSAGPSSFNENRVKSYGYFE